MKLLPFDRQMRSMIERLSDAERGALSGVTFVQGYFR